MLLACLHLVAYRVGSGEERTLVALGSTSDTFRIGEEEHEPEWIRFDTVVNQRTLRATIAGGDYYRTFTP